MGRVNRLERDGILKSKSSSKIERHSKSDGIEAHMKSVPRYANPWTGDRARSWTLGWNTAHGFCKGCDLCVVGNKKTEEPSLPSEGGKQHE
tara:strand:+ start:99 stop:371 length:273 start_codon:yes stop_codon:yes gene_type:complete